jgi:hypothetical protein
VSILGTYHSWARACERSLYEVGFHLWRSVVPPPNFIAPERDALARMLRTTTTAGPVKEVGIRETAKPRRSSPLARRG